MAKRRDQAITQMLLYDTTVLRNDIMKVSDEDLQSLNLRERVVLVEVTEAPEIEYHQGQLLLVIPGLTKNDIVLILNQWLYVG